MVVMSAFEERIVWLLQYRLKFDIAPKEYPELHAMSSVKVTDNPLPTLASFRQSSISAKTEVVWKNRRVKTVTRKNKKLVLFSNFLKFVLLLVNLSIFKQKLNINISIYF